MPKIKKKAARVQRQKLKYKRESDQRLRSFYAQISSMHKDPVVISIKSAVEYFKSFMSEAQWENRKARVEEYFLGVTKSMFESASKDSAQYNNRMAYYAKWIDWYIYLAEVCSTKVFGHDEAQWARIKPFFMKIGSALESLKGVVGVDQRVKNMLHGNDNNADSVLFELIVAIAYAEQGWEVEFIPEIRGGGKTPDLKVVRGDEILFVECKRLQKVTDYSEQERQAWLSQWEFLLKEMFKIGFSVIATVQFKSEVHSLESGFVATLFRSAVDKKVGFISTPECDLWLQAVNYTVMSDHFLKYSVKFPSAQLNALIDPQWEPHASYTMAMDAKLKPMHGGDSVLNRFVDLIRNVYCAKWECTADASIDKKAKDVRSLLDKAVKQASSDGRTVVHIAYETLHGPGIEFVRDKKIFDLVRAFDYGDKNVACVFCHAMQPSAYPDGIIEFAETTRFFNRSMAAEKILPGHQLLFSGEGAQITFNETHWMQDALKMLGEEH
ncbi:hypothetical protein IIE18_27475 [Pseudomonas sp. V1]|uniref:hypothetical protein n=1 Tax=Pseudomonas arcuscaelestis TaxID=2710591 RepID=UPI00193ECE04|nr:hypothetical protein [Pseudomonas arcuscaelestis]MBM3108865.1 hypothetical protein [Pseudomonas arcuscaelestis]